MLEENTVPPAQRPLTIAARIPGKAEPRSGIYVFVFLATGDHAFSAALNESIENIPSPWHQGLRVDARQIKCWLVGGDKRSRRKSKFLVELFLITSKDAPAQTEIDREFPGDAPVVLEVRFQYFITVVEIWLRAGLRIAADLSGEEVRKGIAGGVGIAGRKREHALQIFSRLLVLLRGRE